MQQPHVLTDEQGPYPTDEDASTVQGGSAYVADLERQLAPSFARVEPPRRALAYLWGLLSPAERKNRWQPAEVSGHATSYGLQHLLGRALWGTDAVCNGLRTSIVDYCQCISKIFDR